MHLPPLIAILNTSTETIEIIEAVIEDDGFRTVSAYIVDFKRNILSLDAFFQQHQPQVVIYDIAPPYDENWQFFREQVLNKGYLPARSFVLTTTNKSVLERIVGPTHTIEFVGKPFDLDQISIAVRQALAGNWPTI